MSRENVTTLEEKHNATTVYIITQEQPSRVLLLHHKKLNKWLPPGGHQERHENPYEAAIREVKEETGIDISNNLSTPQSLDARVLSLPLPMFILEEKIDAHKDQLEHFHIDMIYVVRVSHQQIIRQETESQDIGWFTQEEVEALDTFENVKSIVKTLLSYSCT